VPDVELRQLRLFLAVAEHGSFRAAAEALDSQISSVSRQIARLEEQLTTDLFTRHTRGAKLTHAGEHILPVARRIISDTDQVLRHAAAAAQARAGTLSIGFDVPLSTGRLRDAIAAFRLSAPEVLIDLIECDMAELAHLLQRHEIDVAVTASALSGSSFSVLTLWTEPLFAALPDGGPLARRETVTWPDLARRPLIFRAARDGPNLPPRFALHVAEHGLSVGRSRHVVSRETLLAAVGMDFGNSIVEASATGAMHPGVTFRPIGEDDAAAQITAVWHHENNNPVRQKFVADLRDAVRRERRVDGRSSATQ